MLDVLVLVHLRLVQALVEVGRVVILVRDADTDKLGHCSGTIRYCMFMINKTAKLKAIKWIYNNVTYLILLCFSCVTKYLISFFLRYPLI